ncbi:hypothetical protein B5C34_04050 [Pacificimonas flava]|uniref:Flavin reductase like domain-containing protein n=2 Tax=Pacificimonas TaxID=1960290 RepID=A0A219B2V8_9SPHN|nr:MULTISPECIES: flavin reductase family protein [Pacificimonas]MBZ6377609.1 flavin reductase family protein [Pacificimonas aurantium]OWV32702.1 hypothetical protein B5C34_04050 [Pacificimonas flava]
MTQNMKTFPSADTDPRALYKLLVSAVVPRPIGFVSTVSLGGVRNLAPFSWFNFFSSAPPVAVFSPAGTGDNAKDTLRNIREAGDCVIHIADRSIAEALNQTSASYAPEVDEFEASGLTPVPVDGLKADRVEEAKVAMACRLRQIVPLGEGPRSGHLVICDIERIMVDGSILDESGAVVDAKKFRAIARLGGDWYLETTPEALFELDRPA